MSKYLNFRCTIIVIGSLVASFSARQVNNVDSIETSIDIPTCNSDFHKKCIKKKSKVIFLFYSYVLCFKNYIKQTCLTLRGKHFMIMRI